MFSKGFLNKIKDLLLEQRKDILSRSSAIDDIDAEGDEIDEIQANFIVEMNKQLGSRDKTRLVEINLALNKLSSESFGLCDDCEEMISEKRLLINPHSNICISCAEEREHIAKQKRRI